MNRKSLCGLWNMNKEETRGTMKLSFLHSDIREKV